jgi:hypothetical protein
LTFSNALTTDLDLNILHENVTEPVEPPEGFGNADSDSWKSHTEVHAVNKITVTADGASSVFLTNLLSL